MNFTWTRSLLVSIILASGVAIVCCLSDQDASSPKTIPVTRSDYNRHLFHQDSSNTATVHLVGLSAYYNNHNHEPKVRRRDVEESNSAYSRPRSRRFLKDYVHVDISDEFSHKGKVYVSVLFLVFWALSVIPRCPKKKAGICLVGAVSMIGLRYHIMQTGGGRPWFDLKRVIFWEPLLALLGLMLMTIGLERTEHGRLVQKLGDKLDDPVPWKRCRNILLLSTVGSAMLARDMIVYLFSGIVVDSCMRHNVANPMPYLLSLSTAANIGSAMTLSGSMSNLLVSSFAYDPISWWEFASNLLLPTFLASIINALLIMLFYRAELFHGSPASYSNEQVYEMVGSNETEDEECNEYHNEYMAIGEVQQKWSLWSILQLVCVGVWMMCFAAGLSIQMVSIGGGVFMMILHLCNRMYYQGCTGISHCCGGVAGGEDDGDQVSTTRVPFDYSILLAHLARFVMIGSLNDTGMPQMAFNLMMGRCAERMTTGICLYRFAMLIAALSTVFSGASVVQICAATFPYATPYDWVQVSFAANMAGNLAVYGSGTHSTVGDQFAKATGSSSPVSIRSYSLFGFVSGLISLLAGTYLLSYFHFAPECSERLGECGGW